ncbi:MAG TPA: hypothetical protein DEV78_02425 [Clostridiales bacterium]|nr:hypothetical protein [Clostridiales bacterium]
MGAHKAPTNSWLALFLPPRRHKSGVAAKRRAWLPARSTRAPSARACPLSYARILSHKLSYES